MNEYARVINMQDGQVANFHMDGHVCIILDIPPGMVLGKLGPGHLGPGAQLSTFFGGGQLGPRGKCLETGKWQNPLL